MNKRFKEIWREVVKQHLRRWKPAGGIA